ncbi:MAG: 50S ribosomal protein L9 [Dehalococcoidia bacterium]|nr:50S ribosomal protein L9 [Dehalococcoidia bacterium]MSQ34805.1 50S ribosomal protein L9 [Dehalococcoidia bacterium]
MKVIFLKDVLPTAQSGDVKVVKNGFGRNYLLPRGLAMLASPVQLKRTEGLRKSAEERRMRELDEWRKLVAGIRGTPVTVLAKAGPNGRLFGSVTTTMIAQQISVSTGKTIDRRGVRIPTPIRQLGTYMVGLRLVEGVETEVRVQVKPEGGSVTDAPSGEKADDAPVV